MQKKSFFNRQETAITLLYKPSSIGQAIVIARAAESDGADGIAIEIQRIPQEERARTWATLECSAEPHLTI